MKQLRIAVVFASMMILACAAGAWGYPVNTGETIYVGRGIGGTGGGEFIISRSQGGPLFTTFCVELDEWLDFSNGFKVDSISDTARRGGVNTDNGDPLSAATKWLFWEYNEGNLHTDVSNYLYNTPAGANALQLAIWKLEDELVGGTYYSDLYLAQYNNNALAQALVTAAGNHANFTGDVMVMNLTLNGNVAQSLLIAENSRIIPPVPEPSTLLLTGLGLVGVAYLRRKRKG